jgi:hypothetical protein
MPPSHPGDVSGSEDLLGRKTARLFEYLKGLSEELPAEARSEFEESGLRDKLDSLIGLLGEKSEDETLKVGLRNPQGLLNAAAAIHEACLAQPGSASRPVPHKGLASTVPHEASSCGDGLRRSAEGRRSGEDRRQKSERRQGDRRRGDDRRLADDRRAAGGDRRSAVDRRSPPPAVDIPETITPGLAPVRLDAEGRPAEIAGIPISARMVKLIEIMRREKENAGKR